MRRVDQEFAAAAARHKVEVRSEISDTEIERLAALYYHQRSRHRFRETVTVNEGWHEGRIDYSSYSS